MFAGFQCRNRHSRMHIRRRPNPNGVQFRQGEQVGPVLHRHRFGRVFFAKFLRAFVGRIRDRHDLDIGMFAQSRQMTVTNDGACADDAEANFVTSRHGEVCERSLEWPDRR